MSQTHITRKRWHAMRARCDDPNTEHYESYGGMDIGYDPAWSNYEEFVGDMGECPVGYVLDRIDNNLGYCLSNCRWATKADSAKNRYTTKLTYAQARTIKQLVRAKKPEISIMEFSRVVAGVLKVSVSLVRDVARGKSWESVGIR